MSFRGYQVEGIKFFEKTLKKFLEKQNFTLLTVLKELEGDKNNFFKHWKTWCVNYLVRCEGKLSKFLQIITERRWTRWRYQMNSYSTKQIAHRT